MTKTSNIILRAVEPTDADFMYEVENDTACWRYGDTIAPLSRHILRDYALNYNADPFSAHQLRLIIVGETQFEGQQLGIIDLYDIDMIHRRAFVGVYILPSFRNLGIATEALQDIASYAFRVLNLRMLAAKVESSNSVSLALFKQNGFKEVAIVPEWFLYADSKPSDLVILTKRLTPETMNCAN